jgi:hypothetical protein
VKKDSMAVSSRWECKNRKPQQYQYSDGVRGRFLTVASMVGLAVLDEVLAHGLI